MTQIEQVIQGLELIQQYEPDTKVTVTGKGILAGDYNFCYNQMEQWKFERMVWLGWGMKNGQWFFDTSEA